MKLPEQVKEFLNTYQNLLIGTVIFNSAGILLSVLSAIYFKKPFFLFFIIPSLPIIWLCYKEAGKVEEWRFLR